MKAILTVSTIQTVDGHAVTCGALDLLAQMVLPASPLHPKPQSAKAHLEGDDATPRELYRMAEQIERRDAEVVRYMARDPGLSLMVSARQDPRLRFTLAILDKDTYKWRLTCQYVTKGQLLAERLVSGLRRAVLVRSSQSDGSTAAIKRIKAEQGGRLITIGRYTSGDVRYRYGRQRELIEALSSMGRQGKFPSDVHFNITTTTTHWKLTCRPVQTNRAGKEAA